jgi:hypothetical protein
MLRKAKAGHVTGGMVFGYDNVPVPAPTTGAAKDAKPLHVIRRINQAEAAIVQRIFELSAAGHGYTRIAKRLNAEGAPSPRPRRGVVRGWAPSSVREVLGRKLYRGMIVWNRTRKRDTSGKRHQRPRPESEWVHVPAPDLRVISDELWAAATQRRKAAEEIYLRRTNGQLWGRPPVNGVAAKYLLTGLTLCEPCGGSLEVLSRSHGRQRAFVYGCASHHRPGKTVCANGLLAPLDATDEAVLTTVERDILRPEVIRAAIEEARARLQPSQADTQSRRAAL